MTDIAIIDIEASGLHFDSYPIEIAVLKHGEVRSWLIRPEPQWTYWCQTAQSLHGLSRQQLNDEGLEGAEVVRQLNEFVSDTEGILYSDADRWDADWVATLYFAAQQSCPFHVGSIYDLLPAEQIQPFNQLKTQLAQSGEFRQHRAGQDVLMIARAYAWMAEK